MRRALWEGPIGIEGKLTGDGRLIEKGALRWDALPQPFRYVANDVGAHDGAQVAGRILTLERRDGGVIWATGDFDLDGAAGAEAFRMADEELMNGVSMDLDDVSFEVRVAAEVLEAMDEAMLDLMGEGDLDEGEAPAQEVDAEGRVTVVKMAPDDEVMVTTDGRIRAATLVAIPAFAEAIIHTTGVIEEDEPAEDADVDSELAALVASGGARPKAPPVEWFTDPGFERVTPLTVTDDGRVYGHLAAWDTCHIAYTAQGQCIQPPSSASGYAYFHTATIRAATGQDIAVGKLTVDTRHAGRKLNAVSALAHYEDTGNVAAFVRAGEDAYGIWVNGVVNPDASPKQVRALRSSPLSGDWRPVGAGLELVAGLAVNLPGFPIPRPSGLVASGRLMSLVASGMVPPRAVNVGVNGLSDEDVAYLKQLAARERRQTLQARADALAARIRPTVDAVVAKRAQALRMRAHAAFTTTTED